LIFRATAFGTACSAGSSIVMTNSNSIAFRREALPGACRVSTTPVALSTDVGLQYREWFQFGDYAWV
jgi:hypothetical protein